MHWVLQASVLQSLGLTSDRVSVAGAGRQQGLPGVQEEDGDQRGAALPLHAARVQAVHRSRGQPQGNPWVLTSQQSAILGGVLHHLKHAGTKPQFIYHNSPEFDEYIAQSYHAKYSKTCGAW